MTTEDTIVTLDRWLASGIEPDVLRRTVEDTELARPDRDPDRWGD
jgi:hypothetical protein